MGMKRRTRKRKRPCGSVFLNLERKRDSNSRPQPWQGCALPTELFPLGRRNSTYSRMASSAFSESARRLAPRIHAWRGSTTHHPMDPHPSWMQHFQWIHAMRGWQLVGSEPFPAEGSDPGSCQLLLPRALARALIAQARPGGVQVLQARPQRQHRGDGRVQSPMWNTGQPIQMSCTGTFGATEYRHSSATICAVVLILPIIATRTLARAGPARPSIRAAPTRSRGRRSPPPRTPSTASDGPAIRNNATATISLSATGSRKAPKADSSW